MIEKLDEFQGQTPDRPFLREVPPEELEKILEAHRKWVESKKTEGNKADLHNANLKGAKLQGAVLKEADLSGATLEDADLSNANLDGADLRGGHFYKTNLQGAHLKGAMLEEADLAAAALREADLQNADLKSSKSLLAGQLAGANVSGAKLPEAVAKFEGLDNVKEASQNARKLFFSMLLGCLYAWLTVATTTDSRLLTNSASSPLPIIGTPIPIAGFYWAAPLLLLCLYIYFHLYLQRLWEGLAHLPAVFQDGRPLDKHAYPWLLTGLVCAHFKVLRENRPSLSRLQNAISIFLAWWVVPFTLILLWGRYLPRHDGFGTGLHIGLITISAGFWIVSQRLARSTLRGKEKRRYFWKEALRDVRTYKRAALALGTLGVGMIFLIFSINAILGNLPFVTIDLREADVSTKPKNWTGQKDKQKEEIALVKGARLKDRDLRNALAADSFLVKADLSNANLQGADLSIANLQMASLVRANLQAANLRNANLQGADLRRARDLNAPQIKAAKNWQLAFYSDDLLKELSLPSDHNKTLPDKLAELENEKKATGAK